MDFGPLGIRFRFIPAGTFLMGCPDDDPRGFKQEKPQHEVELTRGYWLGETPITQGQWQSLMGVNPSLFKGDDRPVERVSWFDAVTFANRLSESAGLTPCYEVSEEEVQLIAPFSGGYRLPTEAEWERACRAGEQRILGEEELVAVAWYSANSDYKTHPVGQKAANAWGLVDMLGNVDEWCGDAYVGYKAAKCVDPFVGEGSKRVVRGGSWYDDARDVSSAYRYGLWPVVRFEDLGFRLARGPDLGVEPGNKRRRTGRRAKGRGEVVATMPEENNSLPVNEARRSVLNEKLAFL